jgi:hypothetical protein
MEEEKKVEALRKPDCNGLRRDLEQHIFYGDPPSIAERLSAIKHIGDRRLFHVLIGIGDEYRLYEYHNSKARRYVIRRAALDGAAANELLAQFPRIALENKGKECAGQFFQNVSIFRSLDFEAAGEEELTDPEAALRKPIMDGWEDHPTPHEDYDFHRVAVFASC